MQNAMFRDTEVSTEVTCRCPQCGAEEKVPVSFPRWMLDIFRDKTPGLCAACSEKIRQRNQQEADRLEAMRRIESAGVPPEFRRWDAAKGNGTLARFIRDHRDRNLLIIGENGKCKTRAAAYNLLLEAKGGKRCRFCDYPELALEYAAAMQKSAQEGLDFVRELLHQSDILLIDDIAKRKLNETGGELLYRLVNAVYEGAGTRLWITSNKDLAPLLQRFENGDTGDAVISRFDRLIDDGRMNIYRV